MFLYSMLLDTPEDKKLFSGLYEHYSSTLYYAAYSILKDSHLAEDAVQEAFISTALHINCIGDLFSPRTKGFLITIVRSKALDIYRKQRRQAEDLTDEFDEPDTGNDPLDACILSESVDELSKAIKKLPQRDRVLLDYRFLHGLSEKETAEIMGLSVKNVNVSVCRARKKLVLLLQSKAY